MISPIRHLVLAASAAALLTACGQQGEDVAQQPDANPAATIPTPANETAAPDFVALVGASDMYEVEAARIALERSSNAQVDAFAQMMIDDHTASTEALRTAVAAGAPAVSLPAALPEDKTRLIEDLRNAEAAQFHRAYMDQQVDAHQTALNLLQRYANEGDTPALRDFAATTAEKVQQHLNEATQLRDSLPAS